MTIRTIHVAVLVAVSFLAAPAARAAAEPEAKAPSQHQARFAACAHESKGLKGEEHQAFMSDCLRGGEPESTETRKEAAAHRSAGEPSGQQSKMKSCNDEAGRRSLHGDERRAFMSSCLKG